MPTRPFTHPGMIALREQAAGRPMAEMLEAVIRRDATPEDAMQRTRIMADRHSPDPSS